MQLMLTLAFTVKITKDSHMQPYLYSPAPTGFSSLDRFLPTNGKPTIITNH